MNRCCLHIYICCALALLVKRGTSGCYVAVVAVVFALELVTSPFLPIFLNPNQLPQHIYQSFESTSNSIYIHYMHMEELILFTKSISVSYNKGYSEHIKIYKFKSMIYINIK